MSQAYASAMLKIARHDAGDGDPSESVTFFVIASSTALPASVRLSCDATLYPVRSMSDDPLTGSLRGYGRVVTFADCSAEPFTTSARPAAR